MSPAVLRTLGGLALACAGGCADPPPPPAPPTPRVKVFVVGKRATGQSRRISGKVEAEDRTTLSFGVGGRVVELIAEDGQVVAEGQLLARLDDEPLRLELGKARSRLAAARAEFVEAKAAFDRTSGLVERKAASRKDLDAATRRLATADSEVATAQRSIEQAERDLARTRLTAPFAGQVSDVRIDPYQDVGATEAAVVLQAAGALTVEVRVPESLIRDVDHGQPVEVSFPALEGVTVAGEVTAIGAEAASGNAYAVTVRLGESEGADLRPGMTASVTFNFDSYLGDRSAWLVPLSAVAIGAAPPTDADAGTAERRAPVFVYDAAAERVVLRQVVVGELRGNEVEVFEGLSPGDQVVTAGVPFLRDGMAARVWTPRQPATK